MSDDGGRDQLDGFSRSARRSVSFAEQEARALGHHHIGTEHLLLGVLANDSSAACALLRQAGVTLAAARRLVAEAPSTGSPSEALDLSPRANRALVRATRFSHQRRAEEVGTGHVLLGVIDVEGTAALILRRLNADIELITGADAAALVDAPAPPGEASGATAQPAGALACPSCGSPLALSYSIVRARSKSGDERDAAVFSCETCGHVLGVSGARTAGG